ncbi:hypothetical protein JW826_06365 [Candidatus Woesearchaeota archaeon]|nr:hypothetical protein [Candidatus Woesearchaeota archaeon]
MNLSAETRPRSRIVRPTELSQCVVASSGEVKIYDFSRLNPHLGMGFEAKLDNAEPLVRGWFRAELERYDRLRQLVHAPTSGTYPLIKSQADRNLHETLSRIFSYRAGRRGYDCDAQKDIEICSSEIFNNAVIFGSHAGSTDDYKKRGMEEEASRAQREESLERRLDEVVMEQLITKPYIIGRATDAGPGFNPKNKPEMKEFPKNIAEMSAEEQEKLLIPSARGIGFVEGLTGEEILVNTSHRCIVSYVYFKEKSSSH